MKISEILNKEGCSVSFEVFPPKTDGAFESIRQAVEEIAALSPSFMSVTYGAGGGTSRYTVEIAKNIQEKISYTGKDIVYVIGGAYGFSKEVYARANSKISLSKMTFSHQMVRAIFAEQLYRAFTIMRGEPYHHE